ncbi:odorant receptor 4-like [Uranotaenia lowii]|uniref:odorant receptor 4-like n=1 Tax=Uranotaenia lowii TaxID=190385 RepID=UPI0024798615|nr:odorant receptor 4-like [Uranotaenia lowii]
MSSNLQFDDTFDFTIKVQKYIGFPCCFDRYPESWLQTIKTNAVFWLCYSMLAYCVFGQLVNVVLLLIGHRQTTSALEEIAIQIVCTGFCIIGLLKMYGIAYHRNLLAQVIDDFRTRWNDLVRENPTDRKLIERMIRPTMAITTAAAFCNILMVSSFNFLPIPEMIFNRWKTGEWVRQLPYRIWFPCDATAGLIYYPIYFFEVYSGFIVAVGNVGFDNIFCLLTAHLTMQLKLLSSAIEGMIADGIPEQPESELQAAVRENFYRAVQRHQSLLSCKDAMETVFSTTFFLNFAASTIIMCMQGFLITTADFYVVIKFTLFMVCFLVEIFFLCYYGDEVLQKSSDIAQAAYGCRWYQQAVSGANFGKNLIPVIVRAQQPMVLMAWKLWPITINTFGMILNASWSYFTLLRTVIN